MVEVNAGTDRPRADARTSANEHERSMRIANRAMEKIRALKLPANPRTYEIWYAYATGHYPTLNQAVDDQLVRRGMVSDATLHQLGSRHVSATATLDQVDALGSRVASEIGHVISALDSTIGSASASAQDLNSINDTLVAAKDHNALLAAVERMARAAGHLQEDRRLLEDQLNASRAEISQLREELKIVRSANLHDPLTGLANRKRFEQALQQAMPACIKRGEPLSLVLADIDHFRQFNEAYGHPTGDQVLRLVALEMRQALGERDVVARYGGEEFAVILPNTALGPASALADQVRRAIMSRDIISRSTGRNLGRFTVSFGVAAMSPRDTLDDLIARADACLTRAKAGGRNCVVCQADPTWAALGVTAA
jgi:diguanylate cyclase